MGMIDWANEPSRTKDVMEKPDEGKCQTSMFFGDIYSRSYCFRIKTIGGGKYM